MGHHLLCQTQGCHGASPLQCVQRCQGHLALTNQMQGRHGATPVKRAQINRVHINVHKHRDAMVHHLCAKHNNAEDISHKSPMMGRICTEHNDAMGHRSCTKKGMPQGITLVTRTRTKGFHEASPLNESMPWGTTQIPNKEYPGARFSTFPNNSSFT